MQVLNKKRKWLRIRLSWRNSKKGEFVIQTAWISWSNGYTLWLLLVLQWFSVRLSPCRLSFCFFLYFFSGLGQVLRLGVSVRLGLWLGLRLGLGYIFYV